MMMNYSNLKEWAQTNKVPVASLLALATTNDPFYVGTDSDRERAEWFLNLWQRFGYTRGVHLRRVHYQLISQNTPPEKADGTAYENTETDWQYLTKAGILARDLGLIDSRAIIDRRNPEPHIHYQTDPFRVPPHVSILDPETWMLPSMDFPIYFPQWEFPQFEVSGMTYLPELQPYLLEIWCEKSTMNDVLNPLCERYHANLVTGLGFMSDASVDSLVSRIQRAGKPGRIFYISDFGPADFPTQW